MSTIAIVGGGMLGETVLAGLLRSGVPAGELVVAEKSEQRAAELRERHGVEVVDVADAVSSADLVFLVVKPQDMAAVLETAAPGLRSGTLVVSLAAGITTAFIEERLPAGTPVVRVMPNTPARVGLGMAAVSLGAHALPGHGERVHELMSSVGRTIEIDERLQDAVTAVSGSGPAYVFYIVEAMVAAGVELGLDPAVAHELTVQTVLGAATMLRETGADPQVLRRQVTSPGGTTAAAVAVLDREGVVGAFSQALAAARDRSVELAAGG